MKKETIIAIILGVTFGIVLSLIMVSRTKSQLTNIGNKKNVNESSQIVTPIPQTGTSFTFDVTSPSNNIIVNKKFITITGKISSNSLVLIQSPIKDTVIQSSQNTFISEFPLALGENVIHIVVYPKDSQFKSQEKELRVYYIED